MFHEFILSMDSSVCAHLSPSELSSLVSLEAAACALPVIVSAETLMSQIVNDGGFSFSVKYNDINERSGILGKMLKNDELLEEMGLKVEQFMEENFAINEVIAKLEKVYLEVAESKVS